MKNIFILLLVSIFFSGCRTAKQYNEMIDFYADAKEISYSENDNIRIKSPYQSSKINKVAKTKTLFLPLVVYYLLQENYDIELNGKYKHELICEGIHQAASKPEVELFLKNKFIQIELDYIPGKFEYYNQGGFIYAGFFIIDINENQMSPYENILEASYITEENKEQFLSSEITVDCLFTKIIIPKMTTNEFTYIFNNQYKRKLNTAGGKLLFEILAEMGYKKE